jgi:hypothetical protein
LQVLTETDPLYCEMATVEAVKTMSPLFLDTTLQYWVFGTRRFERTKLFRNMGHQSSCDGEQYNRATAI